MVSKKLSKNKPPVTNNRISHNRKRKKAIFVSQKIIINSIFDKSLIDTTKQVILPENLSSIYHEMISDSTYINDTLNKKDYSFYGCNLGFTDGEKMISSKRKALVEFMLKEKTMHRKSKKKIDKRKIKVKKVVKEKTEVKIENIVENIDVNDKTIEKEVVSEGKDSELSSENNNNNNGIIRPQRKRKKPSKFKNEDSLKKRKDSSPKEKSKPVDNDKEKGKENIKTIENCEQSIKSIGKDLKIKKNVRVIKKEKEESLEVIDLIEDNSSDSSSEKSKHKSNNFNNTTSTTPNNKSKIYFREPVSRKPTKLLHKRLKEHTLLDKILLGINCVRKWTEKGLHLSRLYETDLALLNKRLTSLNCILTDLQEHTDENNNRYLSVLLKSELFSSFVLPSQPQKSTSDQEESIIVVSTVNNSNEVQENIENPSYNRPKTKQHVPSLYRQRHGLPGILSKPQIKPTEINKTLFNDSSLISTKNEDNAFSHVKFEESSSNSTNPLTTSSTTPTTIPSDLTNEPQMTASQLLKIKSQKSVNDANQKRTQQLVSEPSLINNTSGTSLPRFTLVTNNIVSDKNQTFYYQTSNLNARPQFPMYLLSNKTLVSSAPNSGIQRQVCVPIANAFHSVARIPLQKNNTFPKYPQSFIQPKLSQIPTKNNSLPSKSVVLKNLLQQTNSQIISNSSNTITTNQMVPLSVFQNSQIKRQFLPINQSSFNNK